MARPRKVTAAAGVEKPAKAKRGGKGHNSGRHLHADEWSEYFDGIDEVHTSAESAAAVFRSDIKARYDELATITGFSRKLIIRKYSLHRKELKQSKWEDNLDSAEKTAWKTLEDAIGGLIETPLGQAAQKAEAEADRDGFH